MQNQEGRFHESRKITCDEQCSYGEVGMIKQKEQDNLQKVTDMLQKQKEKDNFSVIMLLNFISSLYTSQLQYPPSHKNANNCLLNLLTLII